MKAGTPELVRTLRALADLGDPRLATAADRAAARLVADPRSGRALIAALADGLNGYALPPGHDGAVRVLATVAGMTSEPPHVDRQPQRAPDLLLLPFPRGGGAA